ncbi:hypothetical protein AAMO2058_000016800 [Amorphochlora amoebiformis]
MSNPKDSVAATTLAASVGAIGAIGVLAAGMMCLPRKRKPSLGEEKLVSLTLHSKEKGFILMDVQSSTTVTFFEGEMREEWVKGRVLDVLKANPWLRGRLVKVKGENCIVYGEEKGLKGLKGLFGVLDHNEVKVSVDTKLPDFPDILAKVIVPIGTSLVGTNQRMFRVSLVRDFKQPEKRFALIVSMSHIMGDGYTFYKVYSMLGAKGKLESLNAHRHEGFPEAEEKAIGKGEGFALFENTGVLLSFIMTKAKAFLFGEAPVAKACAFVNLEWVKRQKEKHKAAFREGRTSIPFVSTNDVITSAFLKIAKADVGIMALNLRNRVSLVDETYAGNYQTVINYFKPDYQTPELIRKSVNSLQRSAIPKTPTPSILQTVRFSNISIITNWTTFYDDLVLPGSRQVLHVPCYKGEASPSECIIYCPNKGQYAMYLYGPPQLVERMMKEDMMGEPIGM